MLILTNPGTADKLQLVTGAAAPIDVHASHMDASTASPPVMDAPSRTNTAISTATTTDIVAGPASGKVRNVKTLHIRNKSTTVTCDVTVVFDQNGTDFEIHKASLKPGEALEYIEGVGFFELEAPVPIPLGTNYITAAQGPGFATDTYISNSNLPVDALGALRVGRVYHWRFIISKTAAGVVAPVMTVRVGTAGAIGDTGRLTFTWGTGTAAADRGEIELDVKLTATGASAVLRGKANFTTNLTTTGLSPSIKALQVTSAAFDITPAGTQIGVSWNGGTSAAHTIEDLNAYTEDL